MTEQTTDTPRPGTHHPHLARERALKVLFAADVRGVDPRVLLDEVATHPADLELLDELEPDEEQVAGDEELQLELTRRRRLPLDDYTRDLVAGVAARRPAIDDLLGDVADRWQVHRMPVVDRNLLRLAVYELAVQDTPKAVVIDEAVSLAVAFAGEKARGFVNGVLETIRQRIVAGEVELAVSVPTVAPDEAAMPDEAATADEVPSTTDEAVDVNGGHETADQVDEAAQEAYDVALDLLGAEDDPSDDGDDPVESDAVDAVRPDDGSDEPTDDAPVRTAPPGDDAQQDPLW